MSLDVYLDGAPATSVGSGIFIRENGATREITRAEWNARFPDREPVVFLGPPEDGFHANITHNLGAMAKAAGIYHHLWRPDEIGIDTADALIGPLSAGLARLCADPDVFRLFNPANGWGTYEGLPGFVSGYLAACIRSPQATVRVSR